jgi:hypothetical protein
MNIKNIYEDEMTCVDVLDNGMAGLMIEAHGLSTSMIYDPDEAVAIGQALIAAGAEAGAQCCAEGCCEPATEFEPLRIVDE